VRKCGEKLKKRGEVIISETSEALLTIRGRERCTKVGRSENCGCKYEADGEVGGGKSSTETSCSWIWILDPGGWSKETRRILDP
jgi:hypothetical protein